MNGCCKSRDQVQVDVTQKIASSEQIILSDIDFCYLHFQKVTINVTRLGNLLHFGQLFKALGTIILPKSPTFLGNFCKGVKIFNFSSEITFGQLLQTFGVFLLVTLVYCQYKFFYFLLGSFEQAITFTRLAFDPKWQYLYKGLIFTLRSLCKKVVYVLQYFSHGICKWPFMSFVSQASLIRVL